MRSAISLALAAVLVAAGAAQADVGVTVSPAPRLFMWSKIDVRGNASTRSDVLVYRNRERPCAATVGDESDAEYAQRNLPTQERLVTQVGELDNAVTGAFDVKVAYRPTTFNTDEELCAYVYQESCDDSTPPQCGYGGSSPPDGFASASLRSPWFVAPGFSAWLGSPRLPATIGMVGFRIPHLMPRPRAGTVNLHGICGNPRIPLGARRWYLYNVPIRPDGSFSYTGPVTPDRSNNYDPPPPPQWPARPHLKLKGRFFVKGGHVVSSGTVAISVRGARCAKFSGTGGADTDNANSPPAGYAAVAGGNLAVTAAPTRPYAGRRVVVRATGQVGDSGGRLYLYRNLGTGCRASVDGERSLGRRAGLLVPPLAIANTFDFRTRYHAGRRGTREWVCGYLYVINCDAAGNNCGAATGLPPDAGFSEDVVRVRRR